MNFACPDSKRRYSTLNSKEDQGRDRRGFASFQRFRLKWGNVITGEGDVQFYLLFCHPESAEADGHWRQAEKRQQRGDGNRKRWEEGKGQPSICSACEKVWSLLASLGRVSLVPCLTSLGDFASYSVKTAELGALMVSVMVPEGTKLSKENSRCCHT